MSKRARPETRIADRIIWTPISKRTIALFAISLVGSSSLVIASTRGETTKSLSWQSIDADSSHVPATSKESLLPAQEDTLTQTIPNNKNLPASSSNLSTSVAASPVTPQNEQVSIDKSLLHQLSPTPDHTSTPRPAEFLSQASPRLIRQGTQIALNGRMYKVAWRQWQAGASVRTGISDVGLMQNLGLDLLSTRDWQKQPVRWFSDPTKKPIVLATQLSHAYRYLDVTDFARIADLGFQVESDTLKIASRPARLKAIQQETQPWGSRIIIDLDRPVPWQVSDRRTEGIITLDASADPSLIERFKAPPPQPPQPMQEVEDTAPKPIEPPNTMPVIRVENGQNQTTIRVQIPDDKRIQVFSVPNPNRLVIDLRPDSLFEKEILWRRGIRWRQQYVNLGESRFPVVWLEIDPRANRMSLRPIWSNPASQMGTTPLIPMAQLWQAAAAINAGFFNRNNQLPLGGIRRDGRWFSGPILNRGAIAWNDRGQFKIGRLSLQETLTTSTGISQPVLFLNTGYVKPGISRYTPEWGATYTPLTDNEILVYVQNNQVTGQIQGGIAGETSFSIPRDGYLLTLRAEATSVAGYLDVGTGVRIGQSTTPADFMSYPQILGAGPLLLQNRQIVLDAKAEQFSDAFNQQMAIRSCIGTTASGSLIIAAIHSRVGGRGPTLAETAQLMQQMGAIDALNFDGGSSTGLYLGGQLLDRSPDTAARVHNALGFFFAPVP